MSTFFQHTVTLGPRARGCHLITKELLHSGTVATDIAKVQIGLVNLFLQHTSASLSINENADPDVRLDMEDFVRRLVPDHGSSFRHNAEGDDDMPAHVKSSLFGVSITIPIVQGRLGLGTWQGVWLCEHRYEGGPRSVVVTIQGQPVRS
jgi:secondary thiamine-phosphate synthase enzyme